MFHLDFLSPKLDHFFALAGKKVASIDRDYDESKGSPVFTVGGKYTTRAWTEWTEAFRYGIAILHFDATSDESSLKSGRDHTVARMVSYVSHIGVHDHGFNNLSTYGNLRRLMLEGRLPENEWEPVDSTASAITCQGLFRLARYLRGKGDSANADRYESAALVTAQSLFSEPYLSTDDGHQGLLLHSIYHHPNGWGHRPDPAKAPYGESRMWGDYHDMKLAVYLQRIINNGPYLTFFK